MTKYLMLKTIHLVIIPVYDFLKRGTYPVTVQGSSLHACLRRQGDIVFVVKNI
ncbi:hypothetical protein KKB40_02340 [Patescibacteria group bacterium]|nr:hypothetical protein [Patescibacteria group bacterium]